MACKIRQANPADAQAISALLAETWHATYDGIYGSDRVADITSRWHAPGLLVAELDQADSCCLVAHQAEHILGTLSIVRRVDGSLDLRRLYVHPGAQGQGIGRRLLEAGLAVFAGTDRVSLEVEPANVQAIRFYERNGFVVSGRTGDCGSSGDGIAALVMTRQTTVPPPR